MTQAGSVAWFAQHETRLAWRDWAWLLSGGRRRRRYAVLLGLVAFVVFTHGFAYLTLASLGVFTGPPDKPLLVAAGGALLLYGSLMLSQAMEAVTRAFYARGDLELILSSSASAERLFAVPIGAMALSIAALAAAIRFGAPRFGELALAAGSVSHSTAGPGRRAARFRARSPGQALRHKEWLLLLRDPWLMSQSLMQLLYLLPPFFLLSRMFYGEDHSAALLVPVLIMAAGQLAGGLAWLAISGEDAPDLIASAPVTPARMWRAKAEAVAGGVGIVFAPMAIGLAIIDLRAGIIALCGIAVAGAGATLIQFWFRAQVKRSLFRRRHLSSRVATFAEALSSIIWAGAGAIAAVNLWVAILPGALALLVLGGAWMLSPKRA